MKSFTQWRWMMSTSLRISYWLLICSRCNGEKISNRSVSLPAILGWLLNLLRSFNTLWSRGCKSCLLIKPLSLMSLKKWWFSKTPFIRYFVTRREFTLRRKSAVCRRRETTAAPPYSRVLRCATFTWLRVKSSYFSQKQERTLNSSKALG